MPSHTHNPQNTCGRTTRFLRKNLPALPHGLTNASHSVLAHQWAYTSPFWAIYKIIFGRLYEKTIKNVRLYNIVLQTFRYFCDVVITNLYSG